MSENVAETFHDIDGVTKQEVNSSHKSVWMAHWMNNASCKSTTKQDCGILSIGCKPQEEENRYSMEKAGSGSEECKKSSNVIAETSESLRLTDEKSKSPFPMFNRQRKVDDSGGGDSDVMAWKIDRPSSSQWESIKPQADHGEKGFQLFSLGGSDKQLKDLPPMLQWVHDAKSPPKENPFKNEGVVEFQDQSVAENIKGDFVVSGSNRFSFGKSLTRSLCQKEEINRSDHFVISGQQRVTSTVYRRNSVFLVHDKALTNPFEKSRNPLMTFNDPQRLPQGPSTSISHQPEFVAKQFQKIQQHSSAGLFLSKNNPVDLSGSEKYDGRFSLPNPPCRAHDTGAVRICTAQDSFEESSQLGKKFSETTMHHFLFAKTDFNLRKGGPMLRESMVTADFDRDSVFPIKSGVKLKLLGSSAGSEGEKDAQEFKTSSINIRNESSSDTNTMDLGTFKKNHVSGVVSSSSNKHVEPEKQTPMPEAVVDRGLSQKRNLPDINQQPNDLLAVASSEDTSTTSRTQSLDAEHLLLNSEQPTVKPSPRLTLGLESEPSRWVKRLRTSPQSSKAGQVNNSQEKVNTIFSKIMKFTHMTSKEPPPARLGQRAVLPSATPASSEPLRKNRKVTLSHSWVRRLRHTAVAASSGEKSNVAAEVSESPRSKASTEMSDKQFPSLAAMALMGKALRGYSSCPLKRSGSTVVWNS